MKRYFTFWMALSLMMLNLSCSNDDGNAPSRLQLLQQRWFLVAIENINPPGVINANDCQSQTYFDFGTNGFLVAEQFNGNPCESGGFETYSYNLTEDGTQVVLNDEDDVLLWDIIELSNTSFIASSSIGAIYIL